MSTRVWATCLIFAGAATAPLRSDEAPIRADVARKFIESAVLNGLTEDGFPRPLAKAMLARGDFVKKCSICDAVRSSLFQYGNSEEATRPALKTAAAKKRLETLASDGDWIRRGELHLMVNDFVEREYARRKMSDEDRVNLQKAIQKMADDVTGLPMDWKA